MRLKVYIFYIYLILHCNITYGQVIRPSVFNMGGGSATLQSNSYAWSIGEAPVIGNFSNNNNFLSVGVLQPNIDIVTGILDVGVLVFGNQIKISPNPSYGDINIEFKMEHSGDASILVYNSISQLKRNIELRNILSLQSKKIQLESLTSGTYFIKVIFSDLNKNLKQGVFKIIKL